MSAQVAEIGAELSPHDAEQVLRYWLSSLRLEEALSARPRARRVQHPPLPPRVDLPTEGQDYFKLALTGDAQALACGNGALRRLLDPELGAFFESWLSRRYRRPDDDGDGAHLLCFPVVHLRRGELTGLLRRRVQLRFTAADGQEFVPPSHAARRRKQFPVPPVAIHLSPAEQSAGDWPYFLDTRLLHQQLGLTPERVDSLFQKLRETQTLEPQTMLRQVTLALCAELSEEAPTVEQLDTDPLGQLVAAIQALLERHGRAARVFPFAIAVDAAQAKTTWHLQKDIAHLLQEPLPTGPDFPLEAYLGGPMAATARGEQRALFSGPALTSRQQQVAETCWGSSLTAVQGPPGTGKTTLIQHLCAEFLVRQVEELADRGRMGAGMLVVTSSNNRAVDQATEAMAELGAGVEGVLPLSLRAGSRQVCEQVLSRQLRRAALFLAQATAVPRGEREQELAEALSQFVAARAAVHAPTAERRDVLARNQQRARLRHEIAQLPQPTQGPASSVGGTAMDSRALLRSCVSLQERLQALSALCERKKTLAALQAVAQEWKRMQGKQWAAARFALTAAGMSLPELLPPQLPATTEVAALLSCWEEAAEEALAYVSQLKEQLSLEQQHQAREQRRTRLRAELDALGCEDEPLPDFAVEPGLQRALFETALKVRAAWARDQAELLAPLVERLLYAASEVRSPRIVARDQPAAWLMLQRLFGIWGCTLLSLGNCFLPLQGAISRLIIDEAGQCHPAHAVSGLMRSQSALVIGDVHQLTPVVELTQEDDLRLVRQVCSELLQPRFARFRIHGQSGESAQSLADRAVAQRKELVDHFRCQPQIIRLCDQLCGYGLRVHTQPQTRADLAPFLRSPLGLCDVQGQQERAGGSWYNAREIEAVLTLLQALIGAGLSPADVSVITPYRGQLEHLRRGLARNRIPIERSSELQESEQGGLLNEAGVALGTVHRFQGGERSIVLFTTVVSSPRSLPFLNQQKNLLNVAISRAQHHLICIGHQRVLSQGPLTHMLVLAATPFELG